jgi:anti-sigma factor RsiW
MTCSEVERILDSFVDTELDPPMLLAVARHAAACRRCETAMRELEALRQTLRDALVADVEQLDLSGVWPAVAASVEQTVSRRAWARRLRAAPAWAGAVAIAASAILWFQLPADREPTRPVARIASRPPRNHVYIDRLAGKDVTIRREPKAGTTILWVNYSPGDRGR